MMTVIMYVVGYALIGACLMAFIAARMEWDGEEDHEVVLFAAGAVFWPMTAVGVVVYYPALLVYRLFRKR